CAASGFTIETAQGGTSFLGQYTSIALDSQGNPHISYYDETHGTLRFASRGVSGWTSELADSNVHRLGLFTSLTIDAQDVPHISYYDDTAGDLWYAKKVGAIWIHEKVDGDNADVGVGTSIALMLRGVPASAIPTLPTAISSSRVGQAACGRPKRRTIP